MFRNFNTSFQWLVHPTGKEAHSSGAINLETRPLLGFSLWFRFFCQLADSFLLSILEKCLNFRRKFFSLWYRENLRKTVDIGSDLTGNELLFFVLKSGADTFENFVVCLFNSLSAKSGNNLERLSFSESQTTSLNVFQLNFKGVTVALLSKIIITISPNLGLPSKLTSISARYLSLSCSKYSSGVSSSFKADFDSDEIWKCWLTPSSV